VVYAREQNVYVLKIVFFWKLFDFSKFFSEPGIFCFHYHIHGRSQKFFWGGAKSTFCLSITQVVDNAMQMDVDKT